MPAQLNRPGGAGGNSASSEESERLEKEQSQEARVRALLVDGIPTLPAYVFELSALLSTVPVDLRRVCRVIRTDPSLAAQVIRLCNSAMLGLRGRVSNIEHAVILLGTERLRTLVLTCSLVECVGNFLSPTELQSFWQHSLLTATLSERSALCLHYPEAEQAYLAGLLHDLGVLPLLLLALPAKGTQAHARRHHVGRVSGTRSDNNLELTTVWWGNVLASVGTFRPRSLTSSNITIDLRKHGKTEFWWRSSAQRTLFARCTG